MPSPAGKPGKIVLRATSNPSPVVPIPKLVELGQPVPESPLLTTSATYGLRLDDKRLRDELYDLQRATSEANDRQGELVAKIEHLACSLDDLEKRLEDLVGVIRTLTETIQDSTSQTSLSDKID